MQTVASASHELSASIDEIARQVARASAIASDAAAEGNRTNAEVARLSGSAQSTRSDPEQDIDILRQGWSNPLDPMLTADDKANKRLWNSRALINACKPFDRLSSFAPVAEASPALTRATKEKYAWLFK